MGQKTSTAIQKKVGTLCRMETNDDDKVLFNCPVFHKQPTIREKS